MISTTPPMTQEEYDEWLADQYVISQPHLLDYDDVVYLDEN